jgi:hypothetical protein
LKNLENTISKCPVSCKVARKKTGDKEEPVAEKPAAETSEASEASEKKGKSPQKIADNENGGGE